MTHVTHDQPTGQPTKRRRGRPAGRSTADGVIADRNHLLDAAEKLISKEGPEISLAAIAKEAGVTKPTLYREVGDRDAVVNLLAGRLAERMANAMAALMQQGNSPRDQFENLVGAYLEVASRDQNLYLFVTAGGTREDRLQQSLRLADSAATQLSEPIAAFRQAQKDDPSVAVVWSYGLLGALHYVTLWWLRDETVDKQTVIEQTTALLWSGLNQ